MSLSPQLIQVKSSIIENLIKIQQTSSIRKRLYQQIRDQQQDYKLLNQDRDRDDEQDRKLKVEIQIFKQRLRMERDMIKQLPAKIKNMVYQMNIKQRSDKAYHNTQKVIESIATRTQRELDSKVYQQTQTKRLNQVILNLNKIQLQNKELRAQLLIKQKIIAKKDAVINHIKRTINFLHNQIKQLKCTQEKMKINLQHHHKDIQSLKHQIHQQCLLYFSNIKASSQKLQIHLRNQKQNSQNLKQKHQQTLRFIQNNSRQIAQIISYKYINKQSIQQNSQKIHQQLIKHLKFVTFTTQSTIIKQNYQKQWLIRQLQLYIKGKIIKTKLLYKLDILNKVNFHHYIDNIYDFMVVIKLQNGSIVGGYSHFPYDKNHMDKRGKGFLFNLNFKEVYLMKEDKYSPAISYDDYYIIFGNSELRIKSQELKLFSNFGISKGTFEHRGRKRIQFMGSQQDQMPIETYQIYQIVYQ